MAPSQTHIRLREYRPGTFDKRVAYGQRQRKLLLVARGIIQGFKVKCRTERAASNLAYSLRLWAPRIEATDGARFALRVSLDGRNLYVIGQPRKRGNTRQQRLARSAMDQKS